MSGHSKWHNIQGRKGKQDKAKSSLFTKCAKMITVAARSGGGDQIMNFSLRLAIDKAKAINMPKDNIDRAVKKGTGELADGSTYEEAVYEGFGPGGIAVLVEVLTDNKNRTLPEIKTMFAKHGGALGASGSVQWQFSHLGVIRIGDEQQKSHLIQQKSAIELALIEAGVDDIIENEFGFEIRSVPTKFHAVLEALKPFAIIPDDSGLEWVAKESVTVEETEKSEQMHALYEALDDHDDVRGVYTNEQ